ncbi:hypothetical protein [Arthrobacter sp. HLT1-21]
MRINSFTDAFTTGEAELDLGDGLKARIPLGKRGYTIDQSVGRAVKIWDYLNNREQMIYGDTGRRNIETNLSAHTGTNAYLRRNDNTVQLNIYGVSFTDLAVPVYTLPAGFRPDYHLLDNGPVHIGQTTACRTIISFTAGSLTILGGTNGTPVYRQYIFQTNDPWPTTLPGTAVETIPA